MDDETLLAYLAGCMDSDGSFTIRRDTRSMKAASRTPTHVALVSLRQVTPQVPHLLHETFGGSLTTTRSTAANGRPLIGWVASARKASVVCHALLPYLRIKPEQAKLLIALQDRKGAKWAKGNVGTLRVTDSELEARDAIALEVQRLNRCGVA